MELPLMSVMDMSDDIGIDSVVPVMLDGADIELVVAAVVPPVVVVLPALLLPQAASRASPAVASPANSRRFLGMVDRIGKALR